jgi:hypothetical protein
MIQQVSVDDQYSWHDADDSISPPSVNVTPPDANYVYYKFIVTNTGSSELTSFALHDTAHDADLTGVPATLASKATYTKIIGPYLASQGVWPNTATASGSYGLTSYSAQDPAYYRGIISGFRNWPECIDGCHAYGDFGVNYIYIKANACNPGEQQLVEIWANVESSKRYCLSWKGDLYLGNPPQYSKTLTFVGDTLATQTEMFLGTTIWTCGESLAIKNQFFAYKTPGQADPCNGNCDDFNGVSPAKCGLPNDLIVVVPYPKIDVEKYVSVDNVNWLDADTLITGPLVKTGSNVWFRFIVSNGGNVPLTGVTLTDSDFTLSCPAIPTMPVGGTPYICNFGPTPALEGEQTDTATATGHYSAQTLQDTDPAYYKGCTLSGGDDQIICAGGTFNLVGTASCYESVEWSILSCQPTPPPESDCGTLAPDPTDPTNPLKRVYTPAAGVTKATLRLTRTLSGGITDFDDVIVDVVPNPSAAITDQSPSP